jgi:hypothetical protein
MQFSRLSMITTTSSHELTLLNNTYPYIYGTIGTALNLILIIAYLERKNKIYQKYTIPISCFFFQLNLLAFVLANIKTNSNQTTLLHFSTQTCKAFSFLIHVTSSLNTWLFSLCLYIVKCYINKRMEILKKIYSVYFGFVLILSIVYSLDLIYMDLNTFKLNKTTFAHREQQQEYIVCSIKDIRLLLLRDCVDFIFYFLIPFTYISYNAIELRPLQKRYFHPRVKFFFSIFFTLIFLPNILLTLVNDFQMLLFETQVTHVWLEYAFTFGLIINYSFIICGCLMHAFFNANTRVLLFKLICFPCYLVNILNELEILEKEQQSQPFLDS